MLLTRYEPQNLFGQFNNEINRLFAGQRASNDIPARRDWAPSVDIREEEQHYVLLADIPGVNRENVDITLEDGVLTLKGERTSEHIENESGYRRNERVQGTFMRQFTLPDTVDTANISAGIDNGVLEIRIPKQEKSQPRKIAIK
ncbi:MAG: Hsp20/alpha crystallin family protein [Gammaproteobacteria bacterium]